MGKKSDIVHLFSLSKKIHGPLTTLAPEGKISIFPTRPEARTAQKLLQVKSDAWNVFQRSVFGEPVVLSKKAAESLLTVFVFALNKMGAIKNAKNLKKVR